jgi:hypothetical protein
MLSIRHRHDHGTEQPAADVPVPITEAARSSHALPRVYAEGAFETLLPATHASFTFTDDIVDADVIIVMPSTLRLRELRARYPHATILALVGAGAGNRASGITIDLLDHGADSCIVRPTGDELAAYVDSLLRRRV